MGVLLEPFTSGWKLCAGRQGQSDERQMNDPLTHD
jgi:hypothetical protein